jgi:hypothetical protein
MPLSPAGPGTLNVAKSRPPPDERRFHRPRISLTASSFDAVSSFQIPLAWKTREKRSLLRWRMIFCGPRGLWRADILIIFIIVLRRLVFPA